MSKPAHSTATITYTQHTHPSNHSHLQIHTHTHNTATRQAFSAIPKDKRYRYPQKESCDSMTYVIILTTTSEPVFCVRFVQRSAHTHKQLFMPYALFIHIYIHSYTHTHTYIYMHRNSATYRPMDFLFGSLMAGLYALFLPPSPHGLLWSWKPQISGNAPPRNESLPPLLPFHASSKLPSV